MHVSIRFTLSGSARSSYVRTRAYVHLIYVFSQDLEGVHSPVWQDTGNFYDFWYTALDLNHRNKLAVAGVNTGKVTMMDLGKISLKTSLILMIDSPPPNKNNTKPKYLWIKF